MSAEKKGGHYEMVLEDRHLLGVFFAVVLLCAVFFTLGFVLGRNQVASKSAATAPAQKPGAAAAETPPAADDLSFYQRVEGKPPAEKLPAAKPQPKTPAAKPTESKPAAEPPPAAAPAPIYLQVAAVTQEADAKRLAAELRKLGFPALIVPPKADRFYRVQVGPFETPDLATAAQRRLEAQGYRDIIRR